MSTPLTDAYEASEKFLGLESSGYDQLTGLEEADPKVLNEIMEILREQMISVDINGSGPHSDYYNGVRSTIYTITHILHRRLIDRKYLSNLEKKNE